MKLQFKIQQYQTDAVDSVVDCFAGQPRIGLQDYRVDPGTSALMDVSMLDVLGTRNAPIELTQAQLLENLKSVQRRQNLDLSPALVYSQAAPAALNLDIEMETGTGKTYVYIKTILELNRRYGWSKFIIVVPSIAIREGVKKSLEITSEHFQEEYGTKPRAFIYDSKRLHEVERFSTDSGVQVMIINIQAFNATGKDARRIYEELDEFQSRRPIDVIAANRPVIIIDEPQKIGKKSLDALAQFNALLVLRYSATHRETHNRVHRLDAVDAYNAKLVKKIAVRGISVRGLAGTTAYLYVDGIEIAKGARPRVRIELEVQTRSGSIQRQHKAIEVGSNLHDLSNGIEAYKPDGKALVVTDIDATRDVIELSNGDVIGVGEITQDTTEDTKRRIQIREAIRAHLEKQRELFARGIKVLSLFFIDEVAKYRDYEREDTLGEYARVFEVEYAQAVAEILSQLAPDERASSQLKGYLERDPARSVHQGYFSIDRKTQRQLDPSVSTRGDEAGQATDVDAYDLILKDKERLLSFDEPVRFIFSHSALREGWDNPNVFVMGMLKRSDNVVSRRQEIGRGLRLSVDQHGERMDDPATVHDINELTVVTDESYTDFVSGLQREMAASLSARPRKATEQFFVGKVVIANDGSAVVIDQTLAKSIHRYLIKVDYLADDDTLNEVARAHLETDALYEPGSTLSEALLPIMAGLPGLLRTLIVDVPAPIDGRKPKRIPLNEGNFHRREFQELWGRINHRTVYQVDFDSEELITKAMAALDAHLKVDPLQYTVHQGVQADHLEVDDLTRGSGFDVRSIQTLTEQLKGGSTVKYDLIGEITEKTQLTRSSAARILQGVTPNTFANFRLNPEQFITEAARLINEQKATIIVEHLAYDVLDDTFDTAIFTDGQTKQDFAKAGRKLEKSVYEYVVTDSQVERAFVDQLDTSADVVVYTKLPKGFVIPTPVGDYNPDWAIAFKEGTVKHVFFVAETKGSLSSLQLKGAEQAKIESARRFFAALSNRSGQEVKYDVVTNYSELMSVVSRV